MNAIALLKAAIALLMALQALGPNVPDDLRTQVNAVADQAIAEANYEIAHTSMPDSSTGGATNAPQTSSAPQTTVSPSSAPAPASQARIEIVSVDTTKSLDDVYHVADADIPTWGVATDTKSYIPLGAVLYNENGENNRNSQMTVTADDASQDAVLNGTGNFWGSPYNLYYYPLNYLFTTPGDHTITFRANGVEASIVLKSQ